MAGQGKDTLAPVPPCCCGGGGVSWMKPEHGAWLCVLKCPFHPGFQHFSVHHYVPGDKSWSGCRLGKMKEERGLRKAMDSMQRD